MKAIKVREVIIEPVNVPLEEPFRIAIGTKYSIENVLVTVVLDIAKIINKTIIVFLNINTPAHNFLYILSISS